MNIYNNLEDIINNSEYVLTIGNFDGIHKGHQKLLSTLNHYAKTLNKKSLIVTFDPNPKFFFNPKQNFSLTTLKEKLEIIQNLNLIDDVLILKFDHSLKDLEANEFIKKILIDKIKAQFIMIGENFKFGKNQIGNIDLLKIYFQNNLKILELEKNNEITYSSSNIKQYLWNGEIEKANKSLGYNYYIEDIVQTGRKLASTIGFPTANIINKEKILPKFGVYFVKIIINNEIFYGIANVGIKPTVTDDKIPILEVHIFNFNNNIYDKKIRVEFLKFIREEKKFDTFDLLINQIKKDVEYVMTLCKN